MHCYICDSDSDTIQLEQGEFGPCADCQTAIFECLQGYPDVVVDPGTVEVLPSDFDDNG